MLDKNQVIHDLVMLHLEKTFNFDNPTQDEAQLAIEYEVEFQNVKNQLNEFTLED